MIRTTRVELTTQQRIVLAMASVALLVAVASVGVYANFSASASASHTASSATITLSLGNTGTVTNRLTVNTTGLVPGDVYYRSVDLTNGGGHNLTSINLTTTASPSSLLDTDATNGLQMVWQRCSVAWTESGSSPNFTDSCSGSTTTVLAQPRGHRHHAGPVEPDHHHGREHRPPAVDDDVPEHCGKHVPRPDLGTHVRVQRRAVTPAVLTVGDRAALLDELRALVRHLEGEIVLTAERHVGTKPRGTRASGVTSPRRHWSSRLPSSWSSAPDSCSAVGASTRCAPGA